jgi:hypothetical protein
MGISLPLLICGMAEGSWSGISCTRPASASFSAGPLPR